jgi:hypothetical protein
VDLLPQRLGGAFQWTTGCEASYLTAREAGWELLVRWDVLDSKRRLPCRDDRGSSSLQCWKNLYTAIITHMGTLNAFAACRIGLRRATGS